VHPARDFEQERAELQSVLASGILDRAPNLALVLTYICEKYFEGATEQIKEYNVAVEALGRPAEFDQKRNSIVRVEAHRLRKRLREYYESEGANHDVWIDIPSGQYAPQFVRRRPVELSLSVQSPVAPAYPDNAGPPRSRTSIGPAEPRSGYRLWVAMLCLAMAVCGLLAWKAVSAGTAKVAASRAAGIAAASSYEIRILTPVNASPALATSIYTAAAAKAHSRMTFHCRPVCMSSAFISRKRYSARTTSREAERVPAPSTSLRMACGFCVRSMSSTTWGPMLPILVRSRTFRPRPMANCT
jgi:hypothetical protein